MKGIEPNWDQLIEEQKTSGARIDEFCLSRGLNSHTFKKRKYGRAKMPGSKSSNFIEVTRVSSTLSVKLKNGRVLEISRGFNEREVQSLIRVLEAC